jgi:NTP pyrophosphatase (non-canonical NTP hydrolase)
VPYPETIGDNLNFRDLQQQSAEWRGENFPKYTGEEQLLGVMEEVGELTHAHRCAARGIRGSAEKHRIDKEDAVGDILVYLAGYCEAEGIDMQAAVEYTWAKVRNRDWKANPETGEVDGT